MKDKSKTKEKEAKEVVVKDDQVVEEKISKKDIKKENHQLYWFIGAIVLLFVVFFGAFYYVQSLKTFEYAGVEWQVEDYETFLAYHGRFASFMDENNTHNLYLRADPRENEVLATGNFSQFKYGGYISTTPEVDQCKGKIVTGILTLASFLTNGVGMMSVELGSANFTLAKESNRTFADCGLVNRGVFLIQIGEESSVVQSEKNPFCYTITIKDCEDSLPVEKFMIETLRQKLEA